MSPLTPWREELRRLIPRGFLRRDQGDGLFVSDYPRFGGEEEITHALEEAGYAVRLTKGLSFIEGSLRKNQALAAAFPLERPTPTDGSMLLFSLADRLLRFGGEITEENLPLVRLTVKTLDSGDLNALTRTLPPACAEAQRKHISLPAAAGRFIMGALKELERSVSPC
ncbi:MAG: hypothetical protein IKH30_06150 [Clostridia bacterium]|nr:hypothetical protein [Clostridia bacterium]